MTLGYLDPGNASTLVATAAAGLAGVATVGRVAWGRVSPRKRRKGAQATGTDEATDTVDHEVDAREVRSDAAVSSDPMERRADATD